MIFGSPPIVTNGLILNLDAANMKSYPKSGTTWNDLSGNKYNGTLTNGPTFNSSVGGNFLLDGTNDFIESTNLTNVKTVSFWIKANSNFNNANFSHCFGDNVYINGKLSTNFLGSELVTNGSFATNTSGWSTDSTITRIASTSGDNSTGFMRFDVKNNSSFDRFWQNVGLVASQPYLISFWYQTSGSFSGNFGIYLNSNNLTLANQINNTLITPSTLSWKYVSFIMTTTDTLGFPTFSFAKQGSIGTGSFDIDAISIKPILTSSFSPNNWVNITTTSTQPLYISSRFGFTGASTSQYFSGTVANILKYNRVLNESEILQNYNAQKSRFGL